MEQNQNHRHEGKLNFADRAADRAACFVGSWKFIIFQTILFAFWIMINLIAWLEHWDPYPFMFLNLVLAFQAAYSAPMILMSQNRAADRDRKKFEIDLATDRKAEREIEEIQTKLEEMDNKRLKRILEILEKK